MSDPLPQPLRRARAGRWLGGVCCGIARRFGLPVAQVRTLFAVATVVAGLGVVAYVACWLVLPDEQGDDEPTVVRGLVSLGLVTAACAGLATLAAAAAFATLFGLGAVVAVAVAVFLVGALAAWPLVRPAWVLLPLLAVGLPAVTVAASGIRIERQAGVVIATPERPADIPADGYRAGLGDMLVDLRRLRAAPDEIVPLRIRSGLGRTVVALPRSRCFEIELTYRSGHTGMPLMRKLLARADWRWQRPTPAVLYGEHQPTATGRWTRRASDPHAPTLRIDFRSLDSELWLRDYPDATGPLYEPYWPQQLQRPVPPDALRAEWARGDMSPQARRKWRQWRWKQRRFDRRMKVLAAGACSPAEDRR